MPPSILLIEDHRSYREVVKLTLGSRFPTAHVEVAEDVTGALELLGHHDFDVIVMDMTLPDGSAIDLIKSIRERESTPTAIVVISNHSSKEMAPLLSSYNVHGFIAKEEGLKVLTQAIAAACPRLTTISENVSKSTDARH